MSVLTEQDLKELGFAEVGVNVRVDRLALLLNPRHIRIGSNVRIDAFSVLSAGEGGIRIGNNVHIAAHGFMSGAATIHLEDFCNISGRVSVYSSNDDYTEGALTGPMVPMDYRKVSTSPVNIGRHVIIGAGSVVLPGVTLSDGASVGALSLVNRDVDAFDIVVGAPARVVGQRSRTLLDRERSLLKQKSEQ